MKVSSWETSTSRLSEILIVDSEPIALDRGLIDIRDHNWLKQISERGSRRW